MQPFQVSRSRSKLFQLQIARCLSNHRLFQLHHGDIHELIHLLHHTVVWEQHIGYFIVGSHSNVMAVYEVFFDDFIIEALTHC